MASTTRPPAKAAPESPQPTTGGSAGSMGLLTATALIMGSIIGTGVFTLPASLAAYGPISIVAFAIVTVGALALAVTYGWLSHRVPGSGGPYVYAREAFGEFAGFLNAWSYWITAWAGNAAIVVAWVGYVEHFVNKGEAKVWSIVIAMIGLWLPAAINLSGVRNMGAFQVATTVLKFIPLAFMATIGLFFIRSHNFGAFNASGGSAVSAISAAGALVLFSYLGVETASVAAGKVRNPRRNVPRATIFGTLACGVVYILSTLTVFGTVSNGALQKSNAPFSASVDAMFGGHWGGDIIAVFAIISGIGALNGWTMICAEMPYAAAKDGLFPENFGRTRRGVPAFGIIASTVLASIITITAYTRWDDVFNKIVLLSVLTAAIPYLFSAAAQIYWFAVKGRAASWPRLGRDMTIAIAALVFSYWFIQGCGYQAVYYGLFCVLLGVPVYVWLKRQRGEYGESANSVVLAESAER